MLYKIHNIVDGRR